MGDSGKIPPKLCPKCGTKVAIGLVLNETGDGYHWVFAVHALLNIRCDGSGAYYDPWEGVEPSSGTALL